MKYVAQFSKVSFEEFYKAVKDAINEPTAYSIWGTIPLPVRATSGSAGYDFVAPFDITLRPGQEIKIPTGIRARIDESWVLKCYPRSGLGFKYRVSLANTVGIIDSDYYYSDNEGHIMIKLYNPIDGKQTIFIKKGEGFAQGIFSQYGITVDDHAVARRNGGFGSTSKSAK
ncbi:MAG: deoxyuridine 5'-triphosphate nucleotidohydrolase [Oscillospiraceae bacterium]|nr:deoxyuridine 5'-triphosphate nucleotidohydrolase [Oscillospiraceae bacterium]